MKFNQWTLVLVATLAIATCTAVRAQSIGLPPIPAAPASNTNSAPFATENFIQQVATWATTLNTNLSWTAVKLQIEDGYKQATGSGASDYLRLQYNFGNWNIAMEGEFFGVGSQFTAFEAGGGYAFINTYDFKLEAELLGGYDNIAGIEVGPEIKADKMMTKNTYLTAGLGEPIHFKQKNDWIPEVRVGAGIVF